MNPNSTLKTVIKPQEKRTIRKGRKRTYKIKSQTVNKMTIRKFIWIINLNANGFNDQPKIHRLAE